MSDTMTLTVNTDPVGELADAAARHGYAIDRIVTQDGDTFTVAVTPQHWFGPDGLEPGDPDPRYTDLLAVNVDRLLDES